MAAIIDRWLVVRRDWRNGRHYGYPICCIAMFCWDRLWNLPPAWTRISQQLDPPQSESCPVPCGLLHDGGAGLGFDERLARVLGYWRAVLRPSAPVWRRSVQDVQALRPPWVGVASVDRKAEWEAFLDVGPLEEAFVEIGSVPFDEAVFASRGTPPTEPDDSTS